MQKKTCFFLFGFLLIWVGAPFLLAFFSPEKKKGVAIGHQEIIKNMASILDKQETPFIMEIPANISKVSWKKEDETWEKVLFNLSQQFDYKKVNVDGILVLRPKVFWPTRSVTKFYYERIEWLIQFLQGLSDDDRKSLGLGELLDFKGLPAKDRIPMYELLKMAPNGNNRVNDDWWQNRQMVWGFIFDPYVEIEGEDNTSSRRLFLRTRYLIFAYDKLVPGMQKNSFRPGFPARGREP